MDQVKQGKYQSAFTRCNRKKKDLINSSSCSLHPCRSVFPSTWFQLNQWLAELQTLLPPLCLQDSHQEQTWLPALLSSPPALQAHPQTEQCLRASCVIHAGPQDGVAPPSQGCVP